MTINILRICAKTSWNSINNKAVSYFITGTHFIIDHIITSDSI